MNHQTEHLSLVNGPNYAPHAVYLLVVPIMTYPFARYVWME
jgi:hypothetical protein